MRRFVIVLICLTLAAPTFAADLAGTDPGWLASVVDWLTNLVSPENYGGMISPDG